jgi:hypothetical protein
LGGRTEDRVRGVGREVGCAGELSEKMLAAATIAAFSFSAHGFPGMMIAAYFGAGVKWAQDRCLLWLGRAAAQPAPTGL